MSKVHILDNDNIDEPTELDAAYDDHDGPVIWECPTCECDYTLGVTGTIVGCDQCCGTERSRTGMIVRSQTPVFLIDDGTE